MTVNEKIKYVRKAKQISQAELAFKIDCSIEELRELENSSIKINGFLLLKILSALNLSVEEFKEI